jgi:hypothetical protein
MTQEEAKLLRAVAGRNHTVARAIGLNRDRQDEIEGLLVGLFALLRDVVGR